jgi:hypothetical protein
MQVAPTTLRDVKQIIGQLLRSPNST